MRHLAGLLCLLTVSCGTGDNSTDARHNKPSSNSALTKDECDELVRREFSSPSVDSTPATSRMFKSCQLGRGHYKRSYFDCVLESKYSDSLDCAYKARGIDRSEKEPALKDRKVGDYGHFSSSATISADARYRGESPRTTIDKSTLDMMLKRRDNALTAIKEVPPSDGNSPRNTSSSSITANGKTYWIVEQSFADLQLIKVMLEGERGIDEVVCARYGSVEKIGVDSGYCAALIKKHFSVTLAK